MDGMQMIQLSSSLLFLAFFIYLVGSVILVISILGKKWTNREPVAHQQKWGKIGVIFGVAGFLCHLGYFISRWIGQGHIPLASMFEYMTFLSLTVMFAFIVIYKMYKVTSLGTFVLPLTVTLIGWASVFDRTPTPLIPALQSHWLKIHVSTTALSQGLFAVSFAAGLMYIIRVVDQEKSTRSNKILEMFLLIVLMLVGFIISTTAFSALGYKASFEYINQREQVQQLYYTLPPIAGPFEGVPLNEEQMEPFITTPSWMKGVDAPRKYNNMIWAILSGTLLYILLRLLLRRRLGAVIQPWLTA